MDILSKRLIAAMYHIRNDIADLFNQNMFLTNGMTLHMFDLMIHKSCEMEKDKKVIYRIPAGSVCKCDELSCSHNYDGECTAIRSLISGDLEIYSDGSCSLYEYCSIHGIVYSDLDEIEKTTNERLESFDKLTMPEKFEETQEFKDIKLK